MYGHRGDHMRPRRGGGGRGGPQLRRTECSVYTNYNRMLILDNNFLPRDRFDFQKFRVTIKDLVFVKRKDENTGEIITTREPRDISRHYGSLGQKGFFSKPIVWRIMKKLMSDERVKDRSCIFDYDGAEMAIAPKWSSFLSKYEDNHEFRVTVKKDCDENDPYADKVKNRSYAVYFTRTGEVPFSDFRDAVEGRSDRTEEISHVMNILLKSSAVSSGMLTLSPQSTTTFFPLHEQVEIFGNRMYESNDNAHFLLSGLKQSVTFTDLDGNFQRGCFVQTNPIIEWADKEYYDYDSRSHMVSNMIEILRQDNSGHSIAGVRIQHPHHPITDPTTREAIETALSKLRFNVFYKIKKLDPDLENKLRQEGKTGDQIKERIFKDLELRRDKDNNLEQILWSACDENVYSFEKGGERVTVERYYKEKYGIQLQYPNLPIICLGGHSWYPIELVFQAFGKCKNANDEGMVQRELQYYDDHSGLRLCRDLYGDNHRRGKLNRLGRRTSERLANYNVYIDTTPIELKAQVLPPPKIKFQGTTGHVTRDVTNGSFNLRDVTFAKPSSIVSIAVVNFCGEQEADSCNECITRILNVAQRHGVDIPRTTLSLIDGEKMNNVTEHCSASKAIDCALDTMNKAVRKAQKMFVQDWNHIFRDNNVWFKSLAFDEQNNSFECLILPPQGGHPGFMFDHYNCDFPRSWLTHEIETLDGRAYVGRLMVKIKETSELIDPFAFRWTESGHQALKRRGSDVRWENAQFDRYCYDCKDEQGNTPILEEKEIRSKSYVHTDLEWRFACPSLMMIYLPDDGKALYDRVKFVSHQIAGIPTQCVVSKTYNKQQQRKDQYASNIAAKINAKLSTTYNKAVSWQSSSSGSDNEDDSIIWVGQEDTLVVGYGLVNGGLSSSTDTIVGSSVCLDKGCMRMSHSCYMQRRNDVVQAENMADIITDSWKAYVFENCRVPKRILVYRDGMSDKKFERADEEILSIRKTLCKLCNNNCEKCSSAGCACCIPPLSEFPMQIRCLSYQCDKSKRKFAWSLFLAYVISQSQHDLRVWPRNEREGVQTRGPSGSIYNVPSGTVLGNTVMEFGTMLQLNYHLDLVTPRETRVFHQDETNFNFEMVAHGGQKGTSKAICYRVRLNENAFWGPLNGTPLTKDSLKKCTFEMCHKYASATKAVRELPVIKYAKRLANQGLSSLKWMRTETTWNGCRHKIVYPNSEAEDFQDTRPFIILEKEGKTKEIYNIVELCNHCQMAA